MKESDWKTYFGSCEELRKDVLKYGAKSFKREVLEICGCKRDLSYAEAREQFIRNVLYAQLSDGTKAFYNANILNRFYA